MAGRSTTATTTGAGRRSREHKRAMRDRILEAARQRFARSGFRGTNVPDIAREAGISVGLIYRYFASKEELFLELCLEGSPITYEALGEQLAKIDDPLLRLRAAFGAFIEAHEGSQGLLVLQAVPAASSDPRIAEALERRRTDLATFSAGFVADLVARGEIDPDTPVESTGRAVAVLLDGAMVSLAIPGGSDVETLLDSMVTLVASATGIGRRVGTRTEPPADEGPPLKRS